MPRSKRPCDQGVWCAVVVVAPSRRSPNRHLLPAARRLRAQSLYPTWRQLVGFLAVVGYGVAALILLGGVVGVWQGGVLGIPILLGSVVVALFVVLITRVSREGWLMLADLSDAAVRLAAQTEEK